MLRPAGPRAGLTAEPFRPTSQNDLAPSGSLARYEANIAALRTPKQLRENGQPGTPDQQATIARYGSWGAVPEVFEQCRSDWQEHRVTLMEMLGEEGYEAARATGLPRGWVTV